MDLMELGYFGNIMTRSPLGKNPKALPGHVPPEFCKVEKGYILGMYDGPELVYALRKTTGGLAEEVDI